MKRDDVITRLRAEKKTLRGLGAAHVFLFGSMARGEAGPRSDVDIFIDRDPKLLKGLLGLAALQRTVSELLGRKVDLGTRGGLHPLIRKSVERSAIKVF